MATALAWLLNRLRPPHGWLPFVLVLVAVLSPVAALLESHLDVDAPALLILTPLAAVSGLLLARSSIAPRRGVILGGLLGIALVVTVVGRLLPPLSLLWTETGYLFQWVTRWRQGLPSWPLPFSTGAGFVWQRLEELGIRLWWLGESAAVGGPAQDPILFMLLTTFLAWVLALFAAWQIYRNRDALVGLLPIGVSTAVIAFFGGGMALFYLIIFLLALLALAATCSLWRQTSAWDGSGVDYPGNLGMELAMNLSPWLVLVLLAAGFFPVIRPQQVSDAFWRVADRPWSEVVELTERLFGHMPGSFPGGGGYGTGGSLPRAHLLGANPELTERTVFYVKTNDPPPPEPDPEEPEALWLDLPRRYWRGTTFDVYTGRGWENSPLEMRTMPANRPLDPGGRPTEAELVQSFELVGPPDPTLYVVNEPLRLDQLVEAWWRAPGDLVQVTGDARRYLAFSHPPEPTIAELRTTTATVPPEWRERYLALPEDIPQRILDLTAEVVSQAETDYDSARAIESFLRTYTYTLDLPPLPARGDVVDYFLFDLQQGYCDYYSSAMVVMARAAGLPARLASGYAQGTYDHGQEQWVVSEKDGHSWVEIYFDGIGWVEFEPTAGQPTLLRPGGQDLGPLEVHPLPDRAPWTATFPWALLVVGGALVLLSGLILALWVWLPRRQRQGTAAELVRSRYGLLLRWGTRLGQPMRDGQTPYEYGAALSDALHTRGQESGWSRVRQASAEAPDQVEDLSHIYSRVQYSPEPLTYHEGLQVRELWARLRSHLWWLWLGRR